MRGNVRKFWGELEFKGLADHIQKDWSNSLASSTRRDKVVGMGETPRSLMCKEGWILRRKANVTAGSEATADSGSLEVDARLISRLARSRASLCLARVVLR